MRQGVSCCIGSLCSTLRPNRTAQVIHFSASPREAFMHRSWLFGVAVAFSISALAPSSVRAQEEFYKGKTISIVIGAKTGSLAIGAQLVGRHLGKYIPGNPTVINREMPGAAHLSATGHVFN